MIGFEDTREARKGQGAAPLGGFGRQPNVPPSRSDQKEKQSGSEASPDGELPPGINRAPQRTPRGFGLYAQFHSESAQFSKGYGATGYRTPVLRASAPSGYRLRNPVTGYGATGLHGVGASRIAPVSIVGCFAACSETTFSLVVFWGCCPKPCQGALPLDPARDQSLDPSSLRAVLSHLTRKGLPRPAAVQEALALTRSAAARQRRRS